jgi:GntR family transcriptional regulator
VSSNFQKRFGFALDLHSGVPVYRQIMDRVNEAVASGALRAGDQLPTVRQLAVDLSVNPNTVIRAYRELEMRGVTESQQGSGTFIRAPQPTEAGDERERRLRQFAADVAARAGAQGLTLNEVVERLQAMQTSEEEEKK